MIKYISKPDSFIVDNLDDAYKKGYFSSGISRQTLLKAILSKNPSMWVHYNKHEEDIYCGLFYNGRIICGISNLSRIPEFTLYDRNNKTLCRGWKKILQTLKGEGYEWDREIIASR